MSNQEITGAVLSQMQDILKPAGFRKKGQIFERTGDGTVQFVGLQKSKASTEDKVKLTVNVGVFAIAMIAPNDREYQKPNILESHWQRRIGHLMGVGDQWWEMTTADEAQSAGREIAEAIGAYAIPALRGLESERDLLRHWRASGQENQAKALEDAVELHRATTRPD